MGFYEGKKATVVINGVKHTDAVWTMVSKMNADYQQEYHRLHARRRANVSGLIAFTLASLFVVASVVLIAFWCR